MPPEQAPIIRPPAHPPTPQDREAIVRTIALVLIKVAVVQSEDAAAPEPEPKPNQKKVA